MNCIIYILSDENVCTKFSVYVPVDSLVYTMWSDSRILAALCWLNTRSVLSMYV